MTAYMVVEYSRADSASFTYGKVYTSHESAKKALERRRASDGDELHFWAIREVQICGNPNALVVFPKEGRA